MLIEYSTVFSTGDEDVGRTTLMKYIVSQLKKGPDPFSSLLIGSVQKKRLRLKSR